MTLGKNKNLSLSNEIRCIAYTGFLFCKPLSACDRMGCRCRPEMLKAALWRHPHDEADSVRITLFSSGKF